jgi:Opioid growth factor receptor (OGFr) conserved region
VPTSSRDPIVRFYSHESTDDRGRSLRQIWEWDHGRLEGVHDYIQWLFPLREPSAVNYTAPLITDSTVTAFAGNAALRDNLKRSFELMLDFYGLALVDGVKGPEVVATGTFESRSRTWLTPGNHNHLRLTRILTSLRTLGLRDYSVALFERLAAIYESNPGSVSPITFQYWQRAMQ